MLLRILILSFFAVSLGGCASYFVRKTCEKQNWYQVGYDAAVRGDRVANDSWVSQCRQAEAEMSEQQLDLGWKAGVSRYCLPESVFQTGKNGDLFSTEFCDAGQLDRLKKKHLEGVTSYCKNGKAAGLSGKKYKNVCPDSLEKAFLDDYRMGRKKYLNGVTEKAEKKLRDISIEISMSEYEKAIADSRLSALPATRVGDKDPYEEERRRFDSRSRTLANEISQKLTQKAQFETEIEGYQKEMTTLN